MRYDFGALARFIWKSFIKSKGKHYRLTPKRLGILLVSLGLYLPVQVIIWLGLIVDEVFFTGYQNIQVKEPVFIIGNPRSGTTFLHRLLAKDTENFLTMKTWEIFIAPSVFMRKVLKTLARAGRAVGAPIQRRLKRMERDWQRENVIHKLAIHAPEEDEYLLIHIFSTLKIWSFAAMIDEAMPYVYFDSRMDPKQKNRILDFYTRCLQRHLYMHQREGHHYLAKNPNYSPMVDSLLSRFPDAKFIYLVRNPLDAVSSHLSLKEYEWQMLGNPLKPYASREFIIESSLHWYTYPLERLEEEAEDRYVVVNFNELVAHTRETVRDIYQCLGFEISPTYDQILREATERSRSHESDHEYSLQEMGLEREHIVKTFQTVFDRFGFNTRMSGDDKS